jgi:hypothetical protein
MGMSRLFVGAHALVYINGKLYGRVAGVEVDSTTPHREVQPVDVLTPAELVPQAAKLAGNMSVFRIHGDGGIQATGMIPVWRNLTRGKYFSILITDRFSGTTFFRADACSCTRESWRIGRGYVMGQISFKGLDWSNETEPSAT